MRKLVACACLVLLAGCDSFNREEAVYEGLTTSQWLERMKSEEVDQRREAALALGELGPSQADVTVQALIQALKDTDVGVRCNALVSLGKLGPAAKKASNAVARAMNDKELIVSKTALQVWKRIEFPPQTKRNPY